MLALISCGKGTLVAWCQYSDCLIPVIGKPASDRIGNGFYFSLGPDNSGKAIRRIFLLALCRPPTLPEQARLAKLMAEAAAERERLGGVVLVGFAEFIRAIAQLHIGEAHDGDRRVADKADLVVARAAR